VEFEASAAVAGSSLSAEGHGRQWSAPVLLQWSSRPALDGSWRTALHSLAPSFLPHREASSSLTSGAVEEEEAGWARRRYGSLDGEADTASGARRDRVQYMVEEDGHEAQT